MLIFCALLGFSKSSIAQSMPFGDYNTSFITPLSAQLNRYDFYPVSKSTGTTNINIPLFSIPTPDDTQISFNLSYHSSGIKVEDPVGILGYGWSILPGLRITRMQFGKVDEHCKLLPLNYNTSIFPRSYWARPNTDEEAIWGYDGEHDIFFINTIDQNTSFIIEKNNNCFTAKQIKQTPLKIEVIGTAEGFKVTDDQGVVYIYGGNSDYTIETSACKQVYLLKEIIYTDSQKISFNYGREIIKTSTPTQSHKLVYTTSNDWEIISVNNPVVQGDCILKSITFPLGKVTYEYHSSRKEILKNIKIYGNNSQLIKTISFITDTNKNLLQSVTIPGSGKYSFEYNPTTFENVYAQDLYGYYTGKKNATYIDMIPQNTVLKALNKNIGKARSSVESAMQANILQKIVYPTGGYVSFEYEKNQAINPIDNSIVICGLRLKQMNIYTPENNQTVSKTYKYGNNESGYGKLVTLPSDWDYWIQRKRYDLSDMSYTGYIYEIISQSSLNILYRNSYLIWYDEVAEYTPAGKTVEKYNYQYNQGGSGFVSEFWQMLYHKPYIIDRKVYKGNNVQEHTEYEYYEDELSYIMGISVRSNLYYPSSEPDIPIHLNKICHDKEIAGIFSPTVNGNMISGDTDSNPDFTIDNYAIHTGLFRLGRKTTRLYDDEAVPYEISEEYLYSDNLLYNMTGTLSCTSLGDSIYTRYYYPSDGYPGYPQTICDLLSQRNLSTTVIATEQTKISGSKQSLISGKKVIYDSIPGDYTRMYPVKTYYKNKLQPDFRQENQRTYYPFGKLATETGRNGVSTVYLWTKDNGSYPVAKIVNASLAEVTAITGNPENIYKNGLYLDIETRLRNELPHAQITTINAAPLIGVQKTTDPNGITTLYVYNSDNLLQEIIWQGAVIKRYEYNYRNR